MKGLGRQLATTVGTVVPALVLLVSIGCNSPGAGAQTEYPPNVTVTPTISQSFVPPPVSAAQAAAPAAAPAAPAEGPRDAFTGPREGADRPTALRTGRLGLNKRAVRPGDVAEARGDGCDAAVTVDFLVDGTPSGSATTDDAGRFVVRLPFPPLNPGRYRVVATCGDLTLQAVMDLVVPTSTGIPAAGLAAVALVFIFFVLLGALLPRSRGERAPMPLYRP